MHHTRMLPLIALAFAGCASNPPATVDVSTSASPGSPGTMAAQRQSASAAPEYLPAGPARGALSQAVRVGNMLYLSGQLGVTDTTRGIQPETRMTMERIKANLERFGSSLDRVVRCTVFLVDMSEWAAMNEVYVTYFPATNRPARSAVGVSGLVNNARVEIECMAVMNPS